jgi:hypothetical protein
MIALRKKHEAYNSKKIERQYRARKIGHEKNTINPNKASHIISYFTNNDDPMTRHIKQREKRWKENWKYMTNSIANLQQSELRQKHNHKINNTSKYN